MVDLDSFTSEVKSKHGLSKLSLSTDRQGNIGLDSIEVPKERRGSGIGSKALVDITQFADKHGRLIHLTAETPRLKKLYRKHGFVVNSGRRKNFALPMSSNMYREPNVSDSTLADELILGVLLESEDEGGGEKHPLNKPIRTPGERKKFKVYVKNAAGKVVIVRFGDPNMRIKKNIPERRRNFRARHNCATAKDKTTPRYWSCKMW